MSDDADYQRAHWNVSQARGRASDHPCSQCGDKAEQWAFQHNPETTVISLEGWPYSWNVADYEAMCRSCHRKLDIQMLSDDRREALRLSQSKAISGCRVLRECGECGLRSHAAGIGKHQKARGHVGYVDIKE